MVTGSDAPDSQGNRFRGIASHFRVQRKRQHLIGGALGLREVALSMTQIGEGLL